MHKTKADPKVKKTLVRNCDRKVKPGERKQVVHDVNFRDKPAKASASKENKLDQPTLCSSDALASYLSDVKVTAPPPLSAEDLNADKGQISSKVTKKLNFHFNDRIYRNLIELNATVEDFRKKRDKRPTSSISTKRDVEPNIEDFYEEIKDNDVLPTIPVPKPKLRPVKRVENGHLHKMVAAFEDL